MLFDTSADQRDLDFDSRCLTFLLFDGGVYDPGPRGRQWGVKWWAGDEGSPGRAALSYSLDAGQLWSRHPVDGERFTIGLRDNNPRLRQWEPMDPAKLGMAAVKLGISGRKNGMRARVVEPSEISAATVTPEGFVFLWDSQGGLSVSDVHRLAEDRSPLAIPIGNAWTEFRRSPDARSGMVGPGVYSSSPDDSTVHHTPHDEARLGNGVTPAPVHVTDLTPKSLADCGIIAAARTKLVGGSKSIHGQFHPDASRFVKDQFGVDVARINWDDANEARTISQSFTDRAHFDTADASAALKLAAASARAQAAIPAAARTGPTRDQLQEQLQQAQRQLPTRPTK